MMISFFKLTAKMDGMRGKWACLRMSVNLAADDFHAVARMPGRRASFVDDPARAIVKAHRDFT
jgi:hypothetical protein